MSWRKGLGATRVNRATRALWRDGWDRDQRCPPSIERGQDNSAAPGARREWRQVGPFGGPDWRESHEDRIRVYGVLREAGYHARREWGRKAKDNPEGKRPTLDNARYIGGPAAGCEAVDPWRVASAIRACCSSWYAQLRVTTTFQARVIGLPRACGQGHVCPVCAGTASKARAGALRTVIDQELSDGTLKPGAALALVTLTQRDIPGESLQAARDRWRAAWRGMTGGRARAEFVAQFPAAFYGLECTYNPQGKWWHVHAHVIVHAVNGHDRGAAAMGAAWQAASARAGQQHGRGPKDGWDPVAGGCAVSYAGLVLSWRGEWWRPIDPADPVAVYQAAKYPTPLVSLAAPQVAEFVSVAWRKRWHDGIGRWRGVLALADLIAEGRQVGEGAYDTGENVTDGSPGGAPALDLVCPDLGRAPRGVPAADPDGRISWLVAPRANAVAVAVAVRALGGDIYNKEFDPREPDSQRFWATLPRSKARALLYEWHTASLPPERASPDG